MRALLSALVAVAVAAAALVAAEPAAASESGVLAAVPASVAQAKTADLALRGVNAAGAEFTSIGTPVFDTATSFRYLADRGYSLVRLPFRWESVQRSLSGPLDAAGIAALQRAVADAGDAGLKVVLDVHNYAQYRGIAYGADGSFTERDFADLWSRLSEIFRSDATVVGYGLMNEPRNLPSVGTATGNERWQHAQQAALDAVRANGDVTCILVSGYTAGAMGAWISATKGQPTPYIVDPANNFRWEAHHYWDAGNTGKYTTSYADAVTAGFGSSQGDAARTRAWFELDQWLRWLDDNHQKGFIGEFGWPSSEYAASPADAAAWASLAQMYLDRIDEEDPSLVWTAAWATGSRWSAGYSLQYYTSTGGSLSTPLSNAALLEEFAAPVAHSPASEAPAAEAPVEETPVTEPVASPTPSTAPSSAPQASPSATPSSPAPVPTPISSMSPAQPATVSAPHVPSAAQTGREDGAAAGSSAPKTEVAGKKAAKKTAKKAASRTTASLVRSTVRRGASPASIRVTVTSSRAVSGTVTVRWKGHVVAKKVHVTSARTVIRLSKSLPVGVQNLTVSYSGSSTVKASTDSKNRVRVRR
jgi:endoglucanase